MRKAHGYHSLPPHQEIVPTPMRPICFFLVSCFDYFDSSTHFPLGMTGFSIKNILYTIDWEVFAIKIFLRLPLNPQKFPHDMNFTLVYTNACMLKILCEHLSLQNFNAKNFYAKDVEH